MAIYVKKERDEILRQALQKLEKTTPVRAIGPGSVARAFAEALTTQIADLYDVLDFNLSQSVISTASGTALDLLGKLYNVERRTISNLAATDSRIGSFYFYVESPATSNIVIPSGTHVYTNPDSVVGRQYSFVTAETATIYAGQERVYVSLRPNFTDQALTIGQNQLTVHDFLSPAGTLVKCTNPKSIPPIANQERDNEYRIRIIKSIRVRSGGTAEAIRFALLGINGMRDVQVRTGVYGLGSVQILTVPDSVNVRQTVLVAASRELRDVKPVGIRAEVKLPETLPFDITATLLLLGNNTTNNQRIADQAKVALIRYLNTLLPGSELNYNRMIQAMLEVSSQIRDIRITKFAPNGVEAFPKNFKSKHDEQIIPGQLIVNYTS